eukprot:scaffold294717_cov106-Cyclotella_meneghiniana.AAC.3
MDETRSTNNIERARSMENMFRTQSYERLVKIEARSSPKINRQSRRSDSMRKLFNTEVENEEVSERSHLIDEVRLNYIEILRSSYHDQIANGSLEEYGDLSNSIFEGLDYCEDVCSKGEPLCDWEATKKASDTRVDKATMATGKKVLFGLALIRSRHVQDAIPRQAKLSICQSAPFAAVVFVTYFAEDPKKLTPAESQVIDESNAQIELAEADLHGVDKVDISAVKGHLLCLILLNKSVQYVERLSRQCLIPEKAASEMLEVLDAYIENVWVCEKLVHDGRLNTSTQVMRLKELPQNIIDEFSINEAIEQMSGGTFSTPVRKAKNITV